MINNSSLCMRTGRLPLRALIDLILPQSAHSLRVKSTTGRQLWLGSRTTTGDVLCEMFTQIFWSWSVRAVWFQIQLGLENPAARGYLLFVSN